MIDVIDRVFEAQQKGQTIFRGAMITNLISRAIDLRHQLAEAQKKIDDQKATINTLLRINNDELVLFFYDHNNELQDEIMRLRNGIACGSPPLKPDDTISMTVKQFERDYVSRREYMELLNKLTTAFDINRKRNKK